MENIRKKFSPELSIFILQAIVISLVIFCVLAVKFINGDWFNFLKGFYLGSFATDTRVSEVMEDSQETKHLHLQDSVQVISAVRGELFEDSRNMLKAPIENMRMTSGYGYRTDPIDGGIEFHRGIDLAADKGTAIFCSASGVVELSQYSNSYGYYMIVDHGNGLRTLYAHCTQLFKKVGDSVKSGELIASVGSTGRTTGPHLHFEVILGGNNLNPEWLVSDNEN